MGTTAATMTAAAAVTATLRPHGQGKQKQAKRRSGQPAPHSRIITQFARTDKPRSDAGPIC
ncbi:MAG: hypothetical protein WBQ43_19645 [Terriglobales bacterium]